MRIQETSTTWNPGCASASKQPRAIHSPPTPDPVVDTWNANPKPFTWHKSADDILERLAG